MQFYFLGKYDGSDLGKFLKINSHNAEPAQSLRSKERNLLHSTNPKPSLHDKFNEKFYLPSKYLNPYGSPNSTYPKLVVSSISNPDDRQYISPEKPNQKTITTKPENSELEKPTQFKTAVLAKRTDRTSNLKSRHKSSKSFVQPIYQQNTMSTAFEQTFSQHQLAKGDWSPGESTKKYIKNPMQNLNNEKYIKLFCKKERFKHGSTPNSTVEIIKRNMETQNSSKTMTQRNLIHPSIQRVTQNENKIQRNHSIVDWTGSSFKQVQTEETPRGEETERNRKLKGYKYQYSVPDYLQLQEKHINGKTKHPERISVISKSNGWLTVDSQTLSRKNAFENHKDQLVNRETSPLSPTWMQNVNKLERDEKTYGDLKRQTMFGSINRLEDNRLILFDTKQPLRDGHHLQSTNSIFKTNKDVADKKQFIHIQKMQRQKQEQSYSNTYAINQASRFAYIDQKQILNNSAPTSVISNPISSKNQSTLIKPLKNLPSGSDKPHTALSSSRRQPRSNAHIVSRI